MKRDNKFSKRDKNSGKRDVTSVTPSRARPPTEGCHGVTRDNERDNRRDSDSPARGRSITITAKRQQFASWLAGATAEQQAAWEARQRKAETVPDEQLPLPLRGGNLEVF